MAKGREGGKSLSLKVIGTVIVIFIVALAIGALVGHSYSPGNKSPNSTTTIPPSPAQSVSSSTTTIVQTPPAVSQNNIVVQNVYSKINFTIPAGANSYSTNYCTVPGYYVLSFNAPYTGYVLFNETNTGQENPGNFIGNFTTPSLVWLQIYFSTEKPILTHPSIYNQSGSCSGTTVYSNIAPWTESSPYTNQTVMVPVANGTNYIIFANYNEPYTTSTAGNDIYYSLKFYPINVTFSMKYIGYK